MERVTGIGGIFFKSQDPEKVKAWYQAHLGIEPSPDGTPIFEWRERENPDALATTVWAPFPSDTQYFEPSRAPFMLNYRVRNLDAMLAQLRAAGVTVDDKIEDSEFGRFGWAMDLEGNRFELWEPAPGL
ncbi:MAG TPA: VOC family protein [Anaerolineae bacterium]|nr:VOC family protein [Anaerolineae bacterium]